MKEQEKKDKNLSTSPPSLGVPGAGRRRRRKPKKRKEMKEEDKKEVEEVKNSLSLLPVSTFQVEEGEGEGG